MAVGRPVGQFRRFLPVFGLWLRRRLGYFSPAAACSPAVTPLKFPPASTFMPLPSRSTTGPAHRLAASSTPRWIAQRSVALAILNQ